MVREYYIAYSNMVGKKIGEFIIKTILHKRIICQAAARHNLQGDVVKVFGATSGCHISIAKGERFLVFRSENGHYKRYFPRILGLKAYLLEDIMCQTKWKGQPYRFYFKDIN